MPNVLRAYFWKWLPLSLSSVVDGRLHRPSALPVVSVSVGNPSSIARRRCFCGQSVAASQSAGLPLAREHTVRAERRRQAVEIQN